MSSRSSILSSLWDDHLLNLQEPLDGRGELFYLLVSFQSALLDGLPDAVLDVVLKQDGAHLLKGRDDAPDLGENVYAVAFLVHHALHTAHLALYAPEAVLQRLLVLSLDVAVGGSLHGSPRLAFLCCVHHFLLSLYLHPVQPQGIREYGYRGERHRRRREYGVQEAVLPEHRPQNLRYAPVGEEGVEDTCRYRDQGDVVGERPEQVLLYVPHHGLREVYRARHPAHVAGDERQIAGLHGDVGAGAYGDAYVCLRQGWGIVDAVAYHADLFTLGL